MYYTCQHFRIFELVPMAEYYSIQEPILWQLFSPAGLLTLDLIRKKIGPVTINDWKDKGTLNNSGWRPYSSRVGAQWSGHKFGRCFDLHPHNLTFDELIADIIKNPNDPAYRFITEIETGTQGWTHISFRNWQRDKYGIRQIAA